MSPLDFDTEILQTTLYTIVWQVSSSSLDYDSESLQTTLYLYEDS